MKLLLVEDDQILAKNLKKKLKQASFAVDLAKNRSQAELKLEINEYDCVVLDLNLPDGNGLDLLKKLRQEQDNLPVVIVSAANTLETKVLGLNLGADDYLTKPVSFLELLARVHAVIRRSTTKPLPTIKVGPLVIKPAEHQARVKKQELKLTAKEFAVLEYLALHHRQVVTRSMLLEHVWGSEFESFSNVVDVYIKTLRKKLKEVGANNLIQTIRGKGYILKDKSDG